MIDYFYQDQCNHSFQRIINHTKVENKQVYLTNLQESSNYQINITAVNSQGRSSSVTSITTLPSGLFYYVFTVIVYTYLCNCAAPSGKPQNISANVISSTSILIQWNDVDCIDRNGNLTAYNVSYQPKNYSQLSLSSITVSRSLTVTNLIPRTNYTFQVAAVNTNGTGPSETIILSTEAVTSK